VRRTLRYHQQLGTRLEIAEDYGGVRAAAEAVIAEQGPENVYEIPFGGSSWVGATGFINAGLELADQIRAGELPAPDLIYMGCGTAGSAAGLALGLRLAKLSTQIEAVQVTPASLRLDRLLQELFDTAACKLNALDNSFPEIAPGQMRVRLRQDQLGDGYAIPTTAAHEAAAMLQELERLPASLTYTAKAVAALIADARAGLLHNKQVLYWNTYNSRPYPELPADDSWQALPAALHYVFRNCADPA
jgi:D-cysteine desulfhydrase